MHLAPCAEILKGGAAPWLRRGVWILWTLGLLLYYWSDRAAFVARLARNYALDGEALSLPGYWAAVAVTLADWFVAAGLVWMVWRLTRGHLAGEVITAGAAKRLKAVAYARFAATGVDILVRPIVYARLSPSLFGKLPPVAGLHPSDLLYAIICSFRLGLAVILGAAAEIADDQTRFV